MKENFVAGIKRLANRPEVRIAFWYLLFGVLWIFFSDRLLEALITNPALLTRVQTYKGWAFVAASASLIYVIVQRENQRLRSAEGKLGEVEARFQDAVSDAPFPLFIHAEDGQVVMVNQAWMDLTGYTRQEIPTITAWKARASSESQQQSQKDRQPQHGLNELRFEGEYVITTKNGEKRTWEFSSSPVGKLADGRRLVMSMASDITERKRAEETLRQSEEKFAIMFRSSPAALIISRLADGKFIDVNEAACQIYGYDRTDIIGHTSLELGIIDAEDRRKIVENLNAYGYLRNLELTIHASGGPRTVLAAMDLLDLFGERCMLTAMTDISDRKLAEEKAQNMARFSLENPNPILRIDAHGVILHANPASAPLLQEWDCSVGGRVPAVWREKITAILTNNAAEMLEASCGGTIYSFFISPIVEAGYANCYGQDVTRKKQTELVLQRQADEFTALYETSVEIAGQTDLSEILRTIAERTARLLDVPGSGIYLYDETIAELQVVASNHSLIPIGARLHLGEGMAGRVAQSRQPLIVDDYSLWEHRADQYNRIPFRAVIEVPMLHRGVLVGVLAAFCVEDAARRFTTADIRLLSLLASSVAGAIANARELSARIQVEEALRKAEEKYRNIFENASEAISQTTPDGRFITANPAAARMLGFDSAEELMANIREISHEFYVQPGRRAEFIRLIQQQGRVQGFESQIYRRDGSLAWVSENSREVRDATGKLLYYEGTTVDITERKQAEAQIRQDLERQGALHEIDMVIASSFDLQTSLDLVLSTAVSLLAVDSACILLLNPANNRLEYAAGLGFRSPMIKSTSLAPGQGFAGTATAEQRLVHVTHLADDPHNLFPAEFLEEEGFMSYQGVPLVAKGRLLGVFEVYHRKEAVRDQHWESFFTNLAGQAAVAIDNAQLFSALQHELAERKLAEEALLKSHAQLEMRVEERTIALRQANAHLEKALRVKDEFLANMSHELRTPLNAILGLSESLIEQLAGPLGEKQIKYINTINESGRHLLSLINDILDLAKIEAGKVALTIDKVNINDVCLASLRLVKDLSHRKQQKIEYKFDARLHLIQADERRLKQMIVNLLSNAIKFTPDEGTINLEVRADLQKSQVQIAVSDNGIGIAAEDLPRLFQPFSQVDNSLTRAYSGTGLGLVLVQQMARLHGGYVSVESAPGVGSCFTISLPWAPGDIDTAYPTDQRYQSTPKVGPAKILLADDTEAMVMVTRDYLEAAGYQVFTANNGLEVINCISQVKPAIILLDVQMPGLNGLETTAKIRTMEAFKSTPILALTASAMEGDRERCLAAGMDDYISKPVRLRDLVDVIEKHLSIARRLTV